MNDLSMRPGTGVMEMDEAELVSVLQTSLYPGAKLESIKMVLGYCKAAGLDPMQKPVHIVPMEVPTGKKDGKGWDIKEKRDVIMPGIGLYRTQAARNGQLAGISEPEFGPEVELTLGDSEKQVTITVPQWCKVTVYRLIGGVPYAFIGCERWLENYATQSRNNDAPNSMWKKRPFAQLAKCAEAQALRKAFPEVGSQATAEEMEGKVLEGDFERDTPAAATSFKVGKRAAAVEHQPGETIEQPMQQAEPEQAQQRAGSKKAAGKAATATPATGATEPAQQGEAFVGIGEQKYLQNKAAAVGADLDAVLVDLGGLVLEKLTKADFDTVKRYLLDLG